MVAVGKLQVDSEGEWSFVGDVQVEREVFEFLDGVAFAEKLVEFVNFHVVGRRREIPFVDGDIEGFEDFKVLLGHDAEVDDCAIFSEESGSPAAPMRFDVIHL